MPQQKLTVWFASLLVLAAGLGCSAGTLLVRAPQPTATPTKTPRPLFTATLIPTVTPTPTDLPTFTPLPADTPTPAPTEVPTATPTPEPQPTAEPPTNTPAPAPPPPPTNTPAPPPPPTNTPEPTYPFPAVVYTHPTGGEVEFRISGLVWAGDTNIGIGDAQQNFVMEVTTPAGQVEFSEPSVGPAAGDSTVRGAGDNHSMNFQYKHPGYLPGVYTVRLLKDGQQMAPTVQVVAEAPPNYTYAHIDFLRHQ